MLNVANAINNPDGGHSLFVVLFSVGSYAMVQSACQCRRFAFSGSDHDILPPDPRLEDFFAAMMTYATVVMSASFFSFSQFDATSTSETEYLREVLLGIVLPAVVTALGPWWMSTGTGMDAPFLWQWTFWTRTVPW